MAEFTPTPSQQAAIRTVGTSVLVSAGAGSGKTAVLAERCAHLIAESRPPCPVDRLLVVTFTDAASAQMRQRIGDALRERLESSPTNRWLQRQLALLETASISTIHSFCRQVLNRYFAQADLDPQAPIMDANDAILLRQETARRVFDRSAEHTGPAGEAFLDLLAAYGGSSEQGLIQRVLAVDAFLNSIPDPQTWIAEASRRYAAQTEGGLPDVWKDLLFEALRTELTEQLQAVTGQLAGLHGGPAVVAASVACLEDYRHALRAWLTPLGQSNDPTALDQTCRDGIGAYEFPKAPRRTKKVSNLPEAEQQAFAAAADTVRNVGKELFTKRLKEAFGRFTTADWAEGIARTRGHVETFLGLVKDVRKSYQHAKRDLGVVDFADLERMTLDLLRDDSAGVAARLRGQYEHVLVDEFQDVNAVQAEILRLVSRECESGRPSNLFAVGDVKQSIYRFRLAEPRLFLDRQAAFSNRCWNPNDAADMDEAAGISIDLLENFRSRPAVIDAINAIFERLMAQDLGRIAYDEHARLKAGRPTGNDTNIGEPPETEGDSRHSGTGVQPASSPAGRRCHRDSEEAGPQHHNDSEEAGPQCHNDSEAAGPQHHKDSEEAGPLCHKGFEAAAPQGHEDSEAPRQRCHSGGGGASAGAASPALPLELHILERIGIRQGEEDGGPDTENAEAFDWEQIEREAYVIAQRIKDLASSGTPYKDIVILLRSMQPRASLLVRTISQLGVPVFADSAGGFFDSLEVLDLLSLLQLLDNEQQDIPLAAVLRSPVLGRPSTDNDLVEIRTAAGGRRADLPFHAAVRDYAHRGPDETLRSHLAATMDRLRRWRQRVRRQPLADVLWEVYEDSGYLAYVAGLRDGRQRRANLLRLHEYARRFGTFQRQGLHRFLQFVGGLQEADEDLDAGSVVSPSDDVVRIMSIHRSKGLEFPVVILGEVGKRFNLSDARGSILFDRRLGVAMEAVDADRRITYPTLPHRLVSQAAESECRAEEMRVLYVALTRAKERLILVGTGSPAALDRDRQRYAGHEGPLPVLDRRTAQGMLDWVSAAICCQRPETMSFTGTTRDASELPVSSTGGTARPPAATRVWHGRPARDPTGETPVPNVSSRDAKIPIVSGTSVSPVSPKRGEGFPPVDSTGQMTGGKWASCPLFDVRVYDREDMAQWVVAPPQQTGVTRRLERCSRMAPLEDILAGGLPPDRRAGGSPAASPADPGKGKDPAGSPPRRRPHEDSGTAYQPAAKLWHRRLAGGLHGQERRFRTAVFPFTAGCYERADTQAVETVIQRLTTPYPARALTRVPAVAAASVLKQRWDTQQDDVDPAAPWTGLPGGQGRQSVPAMFQQQFHEPAFLHRARGPDPTSRGTWTHEFLQRLDLSRRCDVADLGDQLHAMVKSGTFLRAEAAGIDLDDLAWFFETPLGEKLRSKHTRVLREWPFVMGVDPARYDPAATAQGDEDIMLVRGIIDCLFDCGDGWEVLDYKTDAVSGDKLTARAAEYRGQLEIYAAAVESIWQRPVPHRWLAFLAGRRIVEVS
ncbi:MAG: UvrD-helicase domain-containing protein [Phycisphaerae bacterium]|nr:UvrD-helicase domain-containing protein [Phycisphaerae bacterium]